MIESIKSINLGLAFLLELVMLVIFGYWGFHAGQNTLGKVLLGIGVPVLVAVLWGVFLAPASSRRLAEPWLTIIEVLIFALATAAFYSTGQHTLAVIFAVIFAVNRILLVIWKQ